MLYTVVPRLYTAVPRGSLRTIQRLYTVAPRGSSCSRTIPHSAASNVCEMTPSEPPQLFDVRPTLFSNSPLDRLNNLRSSSDFASHLPPTCHTLVFSHSLKLLIYTPEPSSPSSTPIVLLTAPQIPSQFLSKSPLPDLFLGTHLDTAYNAICLSPECAVDAFESAIQEQVGKPVQFIHLRSAITLLSSNHAAIAAHARSLFEFHKRHLFCGMCGSPTISQQAGTRRRCTRNSKSEEPKSPQSAQSDQQACNGMWFPRTDPVVIMLVVDSTGSKVLLGRQNRFPKGMYSCLAGFMEHGEGIEDAVRREVLEESGVRVGRVRFFGSQPWPFPYSLMLGCIAEAVEETIAVDEKELEEAEWFDRHQVKQMVQNSTTLNLKQTEQRSDMPSFVPRTTSLSGLMCVAFAKSDPITAFHVSDH